MALTDAQLSEIESIIATRRETLSAEIRQDVARSREETFGALAGEVRDTGDEAVASLVADTDNAETTRDMQELRALDDALARLRAGTYGRCESCGGEIPLQRLRVSPEALRCIACQSVYERTHSHPAEPKL